MELARTRVVGPGASARKYDLLTWIGLVGLRGTPLSATLALRLVVLITARYNWAHDEASVGQDELARLWGVSRRTVVRDVEKLRALNVLEVAKPARRGRVASYRLAQDTVATLAAQYAPELAADLRARLEPRSRSDVVVPFPKDGSTVPTCANPLDGATEWGALRSMLRDRLSEAAFARWIAPLREAHCDGAVLRLEAPSAFHGDYARRTYGDLLNDCGHSLGLGSVRLL